MTNAVLVLRGSIVKYEMAFEVVTVETLKQMRSVTWKDRP